MILHDRDEVTMRVLASLPEIPGDDARAERVRRRCEAAMPERLRSNQARAARAGEAGRGRAWRVLEPVLVGGFSVAYFIALVCDVLRWHGAL